MATNLESNVSTDKNETNPRPSNWLKIAFFTAGSALAGGLAAAWWYRKTLTKLRETGEMSGNSDFGSSTTSKPYGTDEDI